MNATLKTSILTLREAALTIFEAGVAAADPQQAVKRCLQIKEGQLFLVQDDGGAVRSSNWSCIHLIAFGKAACPMLHAALEVISPHYKIGRAIAVTNAENVRPVQGAEVTGAGHPLPDGSGLAAAKACAEIAKDAKQGELVLALISGGGSALLPYPVASISLEDKIKTTDFLLASGANINQINCVRKHLSLLKGGGLAHLAAPADLHALILSDVIGDDLSTIASGPTVPDETTFGDAIALLKNKVLWQKIPENVRRYLEMGEQGKVSETPKANEACFNNASHTLIGSNRISINATMNAAKKIGFDTILYSDTLTGEAREQAERLINFAKTFIGDTLQRPIAILAGGETTVTIKGKGKGGRNQEMALAFAMHAKALDLSGNWVFLSGGTDGRDGPTDAAGGLVDSCTISRLIEAGVNPVTELDNNDSYHALKQSQDLLITGATGTNVADLQVLLIQP